MEPIRAPFPYFGGKAKAADLIWSRFGADCGNYIEPFFGSGAAYLNRPDDFSGWVTVNDLDGNVANFWRAMQRAPDDVVAAADWPVNECDLHARHLWLVERVAGMAARLMAEPDYYDAKAAGWWAWGACSWIGGGWCSGDGPWGKTYDSDGVAVFASLGDGGKGVNRQLPHLGDGGRGVNRQLPHLGNGGRGVNRQLPHLGGGRGEWLREWFAELSRRLWDARVCCGDWERICSPGTMTRNGVCAVLLDPPYSQTGPVYANDSATVSGDVRRWCVANGDNPALRIALCGHAGEHEELEAIGWRVETWAKGSGYQGADDRERIWTSPACIGGTEAAQIDLFGGMA